MYLNITDHYQFLVGMEFTPYIFVDKEKTLLKCRGCGSLIKCSKGIVKRTYCTKGCYRLNPSTERKFKSRARFLKWKKDNPEKFKELMRIDYTKNKPKWLIRRVSNYYKKEFLTTRGNKCENCGSRLNLEIHHKRYTLDFTDWQSLCKTCHKLISKISRRSEMIIRSFSTL